MISSAIESTPDGTVSPSDAGQLIDAGVEIVTISKRLGHAKPNITLRIYAHLFGKDDSNAAAAINVALGTFRT